MFTNCIKQVFLKVFMTAKCPFFNVVKITINTEIYLPIKCDCLVGCDRRVPSF